MRVVVLVKASPVMTRELEETMCVAAARVDVDPPQWVRLHPVPFRDLDEGSQFKKYQEVELEVRRARTDRRPETWQPVPRTIRLGGVLGTDNGWAQRRRLIEQLGEKTMCELVEANRSGSGPGVPSLAVVRAAEPPKLVITERDGEQLADWNRRAEAAANRLSLFEENNNKRRFDFVPWRIRYEYRCRASGCKGHAQTIVDWELATLWRRVHDAADWQEKLREKFEQQMWAGRDTVLFVGNQNEHPASFLVLGIFWPPSGDLQGSFGFD